MPDTYSLDTLLAGKPGASEWAARYGFYMLPGRLASIADWTTAWIYEWDVPIASRLSMWFISVLFDPAGPAVDPVNFGRFRLYWTNNSGADLQLGQVNNGTDQFPEIGAATTPPTGLSPLSSTVVPLHAILRLEKSTGGGTGGTVPAGALAFTLRMEPA